MVVRHIGEKGAQNGLHDAGKRLDEPRLLADFYEPQHEPEDADEAEGKRGGRLGKVEGRLGDVVQLPEAHRFELEGRLDLTHAGGRLRRIPEGSAERRVVVRGVKRLNGGERLRKIGLRAELDLLALLGLHERAGIGRGWGRVDVVQVLIGRRIDSDLNRLSACVRRVPVGELEGDRQGGVVPKPILGQFLGVYGQGEQQAPDDEPTPDVIEHEH
jgi:hypothetical protein